MSLENGGLPMPNRIDLLELDIDMRLRPLWEEADKVEVWDINVVSAYMRAAYGKGYVDALTEPRGKLADDHGYQVPPEPSEANGR